jgi:hypothetical protein
MILTCSAVKVENYNSQSILASRPMQVRGCIAHENEKNRVVISQIGLFSGDIYYSFPVADGSWLDLLIFSDLCNLGYVMLLSHNAPRAVQ